jgi:sugar phosphate isomerase/epimerase
MRMAGNGKDHIYFGTVLLERNRWVQGERRPSLAVSDWVRRMADDGFDGLELWENHAVLAGEEERGRLRESPVPVKLFNSYDRCETETLDARRRAAEMARFFGAEGMKFNFGRDAVRHETYVEHVKAWRAMLPRGFRFLCECHGGTTMEDPEKAAETFRRMGRSDYEVIIHGFGGEDEGVKKLFVCHGDGITHIHVNLSPKGPVPEADVRARVELLRAMGFRGSFTIEFTEGVGADDECMETLYRNAVRDLNLLRACLRP